jgi:hypothetical protein
MATNDHNALLGSWRLVSASFCDADTGEVFDLHGPNPTGSIIFGSDQRMMAIVISSKRISPTTDPEAAALLRDMSAYTGRFSVAGTKCTIEVDTAWHPAWENTRQIRFYELEGDKLTLTSEANGHPSYPGRRGHGIIVWTRQP